MHRSKLAVPLELAALALLSLSCSDSPTLPIADAPVFGSDASFALTPSDGVRISEIHYDNNGTDTGEAIEVAGPAGTDLTGWSVALYNGSTGEEYTTTALSGTLPATCGDMGVTVLNYPTNGIQNGSPDGIALVDASGAVVEFLSYEGDFEAAEGPAAGMTSTDVGVAESSSTPAGYSLQRTSASAWNAPAESSFGSCNEDGDGGDDGGGGDGGDAAAFLSELHYDNDGADAEEAVEVAGDAGTDLSGWSVVLYNGSNGAAYGTISLSGTIPSDCREKGGLRFDFAGIQNGSPDGLALVDASGAVVEFLSYEGVLTAVDGPASGMSSTDIGVAEGGSTQVGESLQRDAPGAAWYGPVASTWGCEADDGGDGGGSGEGNTDPVFLSEIRADQPGGDADEYFEVGGAAGASLAGVTLIVVGDNASGGGAIEEVTSLSGNVLSSAGAFVVAEGSFTLGTADMTASLNFENGDNPTYMLVRGFTGSNGQDLDTDNDGTLDETPWSALVDCVSLIEFLGGMPVYCDARLGAEESFTPGHVVRTDGGWTSATFTPGPGSDSPGELEFDPATAVAGVIAPWGVGEPGEPSAILVSASFVRLPVGFNRALFIDVVDAFRDEVPGATVSFSSSDAGVVTSDQFGNLTAQGVGDATLTLTVDGAEHITAEVDVDVIPDVPSGVAYQDHLEFGTPTDATPADEHLIVRDEMALSYNAARGGSNWVSWNLDGSHIGSTARCDCYTPEPERPAGSYGVVNFDYTGSGYSRGHVTQSFNRTVTLPDNAATFYTSNILPMAGANNGGPWGSFESFTVDRANAGAEVWLVAGGQYAPDAPTLKDEGRVAIPSWTWKLAVFLDRDETLPDVTAFEDLDVIAIRTPNRVEPGVEGSVSGISTDWRDYTLTVDELEALVGYDLLDLLPQSIEPIVESGFDALLAAWATAEASVGNGARVALGQKLKQATKQLEAGRPGIAADRIRTFVHQLDVFEGNGKLDGASAAALRAEAERVLEVLAGRS